MHDWVGKVINCELYKKLKFCYTIKLYMRKPESVVENEMPKIFWDFEIQTDPLIPTRRPDLVMIKKRSCWLVDFAVPADNWVKIKEN